MNIYENLEGNEKKYKEIISQLKKEDASIFDEIRENIDQILQILKKDIQNQNVLQFSFIFLGNLYHRDNIQIKESFHEELLSICSKVVLEKNDFKSSCYIMWFLSEQKKIKNFDTIFKMIQHTLKASDVKLLNESLLCLHQYLKIFPKETIHYTPKWIIYVLNHLFIEKTSNTCYNILNDTDLEKFFIQIPSEVQKQMKEKFKTIFPFIKEKLKMNNQEEVLKGLMAWGISIILLGKYFFRDDEFNSIIQSLETPLAHKNIKIRTEAFHNWRYLIMNIVYYTEKVENSQNRLTLIMRPILGYLKSDINEEIRNLCYQNWLFLIKCINSHLNSPLVFQNVIEPILQFVSQEVDVNLFKMIFSTIKEMIKNLNMKLYLKHLLGFIKLCLHQANTSELISFYRKLCKSCENNKEEILIISEFTGNLFHECPIEEFSNLQWSNFIYDLLEILLQFKYCNNDFIFLKWIQIPRVYFEKTTELFERGIGYIIKNISNFNEILKELKDPNLWKLIVKNIKDLNLGYTKIESILSFPINRNYLDEETKILWKELFLSLEDSISDMSLKMIQIMNEKNMDVLNEIFHIICETTSSYPECKLSNFVKLIEKLDYKKKRVQESILVFLNGIKTSKRALGAFASLYPVLTSSRKLWKCSLELLERCSSIDKKVMSGLEETLLSSIQIDKIKSITIEFCQKFIEFCPDKIKNKIPKRKAETIEINDDSIELIPKKRKHEVENLKVKEIKEEKIEKIDEKPVSQKIKENVEEINIEKDKIETKKLIPSINTNKLFEEMNQSHDSSLKDSKLFPELIGCKEKYNHPKIKNINTIGELCAMNIEDIPPSINVYELKSWITTNYGFIIHRNQLEKSKGNINNLSKEELLNSQESLLNILFEITSTLKNK